MSSVTDVEFEKNEDAWMAHLAATAAVVEGRAEEAPRSSTVTELPSGNLLVPARAETDGVIGDGMIEIEPGSPLFEEWLPWSSESDGSELTEAQNFFLEGDV